MKFFSKSYLGALAAIAMVSVMLAACGGDSGGTSMSNGDLLKKAAINMKAAKSYNLDVNADTAGMAITMNGDLDLANKNSTLKMSAAGTNINMVAVGGESFTSVDGGKTYVKGDSGASGATDSFTKMWDGFNAADVDKSASALKDGSPATEKIDGADTKHMTASIKDLSSLASSTGGSGSTEGNIDLWISTDANPTVRQMKLAGTSDGKPLTATIKWSKINEPVTVKKPEGVQ